MRSFASVLVVLSLTLAACGSNGGGPTAPSNQIPNVVGTYTGNVTITYPELQASVTCPTTTSVTQSGATVSIAPLILRGQCGTLSIPLGSTSIDATGNIGSDTGTFTEPSCGGRYNYSASGGFFGKDLRLSMSATSSTCYNFNFTATLTR
jgi:hypothetical protein